MASSGGDAGAQVALLVQLAGDPRHRRRPLVLPALDRAADRLLVELRHRAQRAPGVALGGEHLRRRAQAAAERVAGVGAVRRLDQALVAGALLQVGADGVEHARPRAEDRVDRGAGHARHGGDLLDRDRLGGRRAQALEHGVDDPLARLLGVLGALSLLVAAGGHGREASDLAGQRVRWMVRLAGHAVRSNNRNAGPRGRRRPRRAGGRGHARPRGHRDAGGGEARHPLGRAARHRRQHRDDGAAALLGPRAAGARRRARRRVARARHADARRRRDRPSRSRSATRRPTRARWSARPPPPACRRTSSSASSKSTSPRCPRCGWSAASRS